MSRDSEELASRLAELRQAYQTRLSGDLTAMSAQIRAMGEADPAEQRDGLNRLHHGLHKLAGAAGTFGFSQLGQQARRLEQEVSDCQATERFPLAVEWLDSIFQRVESLHQRFTDEDSQYTGVSLESSTTADGEGQPTIWMVERDEMLADYILQQLNSFGFFVRAFSSPEGLQEALEEVPDVLLLDHRAGQAEEDNSVDFWQSRLKRFDCPVIFMGADETFSARLNAVRAGAQAYFAKPIDIPSLAARISQALKSGHEAPERVLVVDDDESIGAHFKHVLEDAGMVVRVVHQPDSLIEQTIAFKPEVVLMDLHMGQVSGAELVMVLRQFDRLQNLPIIYVSSEPSQDQRVQALMVGGDAFIEKPVEKQLLINACRTRVRRQRRMEEAISRDGLTGLLKHSSIKEAVEQELAAAQRHRHPVCIAMLDIDHFKQVNDTHGHAVGDIVIRTTGTLLRQHFRTTDRLGRYGGEEFVVVLPHCPIDEAERLLNALRESFSAIRFVGKSSRFRCTLSAGVALFDGNGEANPDALLEQADQALYRAKNGGRNQVCRATAASG